MAREARTSSLEEPVSDVAVARERLPASRNVAHSGHISSQASTSLVLLDVPLGLLSEGKD